MYTKNNVNKLTPEAAKEYLTQAVREGKVRIPDLTRYNEISKIEKRLSFLRGQQTPNLMPTPTQRPVVRRKRRSRRLGGSIVASQRLQGQYIQLIGKFPQSKRGQYKKIVASAGRQAAIDQMRHDLGL